MEWETVIGLETHVELATRTKIFCSCTTEFGGAANTHCCPVCTGMPGTLPVLNKKVLEYAVKTSLALNCEVTRYSKFDRKNYFYPDLPKAYQISQLYLPIGRDGKVPIKVGSEEKVIRIHELHMEEDAGKLVHDNWIDQTRADYNRCGVPLVEIVTEPDFRTADEVIAYLEKLRSTLTYLGVSDCKMQEGSLRCDVNLSVRPKGSSEFGTRTEMKNLNSFKAIARAIRYEARRQQELIELDHKRVIQETRRWDENKDASFSMRSKENAQDYRYFPEPDIPPVELSESYLSEVKAGLPEMAEAKQARYISAFGLPAYDAGLLTETRERCTGRRPQGDRPLDHGGSAAPAEGAGTGGQGDALRSGDAGGDYPDGRGRQAEPGHCLQGIRGSLCRERRPCGLREGARPGADPGYRAGGIHRCRHSGRQPRSGDRIPGRQGKAVRLLCGPVHEGTEGQSRPQGRQ